MPVNILSQSVNIKDLLLKARRSLFTKTLLHLLAPKIKKKPGNLVREVPD